MKSLALYIDKWYIVGTVCTDGYTRLVKLPNREDRIWLYFYEDVVNNEISYSKGFQCKFRNNENHYYGNVFSLITRSAAKYTMFNRSQPMTEIFKSAKIFDDLRKDMDEDGDITTYVSFSQDITAAQRWLFLEELKKEHFDVKESVARIDLLALEYAARNASFGEEGYYLVLNACNENLHYSIYKKSTSLFNRVGEDALNGMGTDVRSRALIEHVMDRINARECFLKTENERETEYLRMNQYVDDWIVKLNTASNLIPIQITNVTFSHDPYKDYSVSVCKARIDERTDKIVKDIINVVVNFVKASVSHDQIKGILFLGNTFTNNQFREELSKHYNIESGKMINYKDEDLSSLVSSYTFIDCEQFSAASKKFQTDAEEEIKALERAREEAEALQKHIQELTNNYHSALNEGRYDDALKFCNELIDVDFVNSRRWRECIADINSKKERAAEEKRRWEKLLRDIDSSLLNEDWEKLKDLCKEALEIRENVDVRSKLKKAEEKISEIQKNEQFKEAMSEINELAVRKEFDEALSKLRSLERTLKEEWMLDREKESIIRDTRKRLFDFGQSQTDGSPQEPIKNPVNSGFGWDFGTHSQPKQSPNCPQNNPESFDKFFDSDVTSRVQSKTNGKNMNDGFDF